MGAKCDNEEAIGPGSRASPPMEWQLSTKEPRIDSGHNVFPADPGPYCPQGPPRSNYPTSFQHSTDFKSQSLYLRVRATCLLVM